jgi:hypothetical protein
MWRHALAAAAALAAALLAGRAAGSAELRAVVPEGARAETVFDWKSEACEPWDVPDSPARAWVGADGRVRLVAAHHRSRVAVGPDLDRIEHRCRIAFQAGHRDDPGHFDDHGWLVSPYSPDGRTVYGLVHNEFHGHRRRELCPTGNYMACWWNALVLTVSKDGGETFSSPGRYVAGVPYRFRGDLGRRAGVFAPSNIVSHEGWYYAAAFAEAIGAQRRGVCVMRTRDLSDAASWRAWDGEGFTVRFADPYRESPLDEAAHVCAPLPPASLPFTVSSLVRHRPTGQWIAVMAGKRAERPGGEAVSGIWASTSWDLLDWSRPSLVWAAPLLTSKDCGRDDAYYYPAILDPDSPSRNFEDTDGNAFLYLTRLAIGPGCRPGQERDLIRLPLEIGNAPSAGMSASLLTDTASNPSGGYLD